MSEERIESSLAVVPWAALYSRLDASEVSATHEQEIDLEPELIVIDEVTPAPRSMSRVAMPMPVMFPPSRRRAQPSQPSQPRPSPTRAAPRQLGWLETPVIHLSHIAVLVVSGTMFGIGLSAFALELLASLPGLEFLKL